MGEMPPATPEHHMQSSAKFGMSLISKHKTELRPEMQAVDFEICVPGMVDELRSQKPFVAISPDVEDSLLRSIKLLERLTVAMDELRRSWCGQARMMPQGAR